MSADGVGGWRVGPEPLLPEVRSSKLDDVLDVDDVFHSLLLHDLALRKKFSSFFYVETGAETEQQFC